MNIELHVPPVEADCERNRAIEPEGERLRQELVAWLKKNGIVSILMDTPEHVIHVQIAHRLPPLIKPVLTLWGSIYVRDDAVALGEPEGAKVFKNWRCLTLPPGAGGWMNDEARRACIRRGDHSGPHRNRFWEWRDGDLELTKAHRRKAKAV